MYLRMTYKLLLMYEITAIISFFFTDIINQLLGLTNIK